VRSHYNFDTFSFHLNYNEGVRTHLTHVWLGSSFGRLECVHEQGWAVDPRPDALAWSFNSGPAVRLHSHSMNGTWAQRLGFRYDSGSWQFINGVRARSATPTVVNVPYRALLLIASIPAG